MDKIKKIIQTLKKDQNGTSLVELTIYVAIFAIISTIIISMVVQLVHMKNHATSISIISNEVTAIFEKIIHDVRNCDSFTVVDSSRLEVVNGAVTTEFRLEDNIIIVTEDGESYYLTTNQVRALRLNFIDWTSVNSDYLLHVDVEVERGGLIESFQTSVHQR